MIEKSILNEFKAKTTKIKLENIFDAMKEYL
jgi:hypothetical protein